ncbi:hypothetical protein Pcinc_015085 [Petrolisthes cinctipes]|uniref:Uncharacterized protein n=1 Tax=Petrolisthes cinctipes TaxID=88211 RepID=A0AAE1KR43_PETCI|nr:hypothetical protein Pcinc_015085 [Petrolisthes cinctipes]
MTSSPSHGINKIVSKISILFGSRPSYPSFYRTDCHRYLGGECMDGLSLEIADCDFVAAGSCGTNCSCCIKCSDSGKCLANGGQCQPGRECPPKTYIDILSPCRSPSTCVCCQNCTQTQECMDGESNDVGQCTGNDKLLLMDVYYKPSTPLNCENPECNCVLKCGGASCEANNGTCIRKGETCPPGLLNNAAAERCGCNNNATCICCIPVNIFPNC